LNFSLWLWPYARWGGVEAMGDVAVRAEELGFASISVSDHTICTTGPESAGVMPVWPDWSVLTAYLATRTSTIRFVTTVVIPYRPPFAMAKQIATIDHVSGGRFTLAAASGWLEREFEMLRVNYAARGAITDEYLRAMRILWTEERPEFQGEYVSFSEIIFEPKCVQAPHVPIWVAGGAARGPVARFLELGDGWMPMGGGLDDKLRETVLRLKGEIAERGRDPEAMAFRYTIGVGRANAALEAISKSISVGDPTALGESAREVTPEAVAEEITAFADAGFTELAINFTGDSAPEVHEQLEWFADRVMPLV
jgi:probable F420-dependent oxidoreductase